MVADVGNFSVLVEFFFTWGERRKGRREGKEREEREEREERGRYQ